MISLLRIRIRGLPICNSGLLPAMNLRSNTFLTLKRLLSLQSKIIFIKSGSQDVRTMLREGSQHLLKYSGLLHTAASEGRTVGTEGSEWVIKNKRKGRPRSTQKFILSVYVSLLQSLWLHNWPCTFQNLQEVPLKMGYVKYTTENSWTQDPRGWSRINQWTGFATWIAKIDTSSTMRMLSSVILLEEYGMTP